MSPNSQRYFGFWERLYVFASICFWVKSGDIKSNEYNKEYIELAAILFAFLEIQIKLFFF